MVSVIKLKEDFRNFFTNSILKICRMKKNVILIHVHPEIAKEIIHDNLHVRVKLLNVVCVRTEIATDRNRTDMESFTYGRKNSTFCSPRKNPSSGVMWLTERQLKHS